MAIDSRDHGFRVNVLTPGQIGGADEMAAAAAYLVSNAVSDLNGVQWLTDGDYEVL